VFDYEAEEVDKVQKLDTNIISFCLLVCRSHGGGGRGAIEELSGQLDQ